MSPSRSWRRASVVAIIAVVVACSVFFVLRRQSGWSCTGVGISQPLDQADPAGERSPEAVGISIASAGFMWPKSSEVPSDGWTNDDGKVRHELPNGQTFQVEVRKTSSGGWVARSAAICRS